MTLSYLKVVRVMCRRNLYYTGTELSVYISIRLQSESPCSQSAALRFCQSDGYIFHPPDGRQLPYRPALFPDVSLRSSRNSVVLGVRPHHQRIFDMPEMSCLLLILYLSVGNGCIAYRTPVDDTGTLVNIAFFIQS